MNISFLSVLVSLIMLFNGGAVLPAQPDTAYTLSLSDLTMSRYGTEILSVEPEFRLTVAPGSDQTFFRFEIEKDGEIYLPLTAELTNDDLAFSITDFGGLYKTTLENLGDQFMMENPEELEEIKPVVGNLLSSVKTMYTDILDVENDNFLPTIRKYMALQMAVMNMGEGEDTTLLAEDKEYPAKKYEISMSPADSIKMMDSYLTCDIESYQNFAKSFLSLMSYAMGSEVTSFSQLLTAGEEMGLTMEETEPIPVTLILADTEEGLFLSSSCKTTQDGTDVDARITAAYKQGELSMHMTMNMMDTVYETPVTADIDFVVFPGSFALHMVMNTHETNESEVSENDGSFYTSTTVSDQIVHFNIDYAQDSGTSCFSANMGMGGSMQEYKDDKLVEEQTIPETDALAVSVNGTPTEYGKEYECKLVLGEGEGMTMEMGITAGWEKTDVPDFFDGSTLYTIENYGEPTQETMIQLAADMETLRSDLEVLSKDSGVAAVFSMMDLDLEELLDSFPTTEDILAEEDEEAVTEETEEVVTEYPASYDPETDEAVEVSTWEEADLIFEGIVPNFETPDGFDLSRIEVNSYSLKAYFEGNEREFYLDTNNFADGSHLYFSQDDEGELTEVPYLVTLNTYSDGNLYCIDSVSSYQEVTVYFETDFSIDEGLEILDCLYMD